ncbi:heavy-metal-associated domain-containing protein [Paenibacillus aestuarii]|uniref:Heavy-metal-associated domain-containing protein n=1 Tax=Paenibacillus aestuarii TaxID=516965 RepID=A0ABW0K4B3_9BACL|nr:heavy-metal-associated domain-containing protein [Paenibacillus aestuarii]
MVTRTMVIQDMNVQEDADKISQALQQVWGIHKAEVSLARKEAVFTYDEAAASFQDFHQAVRELGFDVNQEDGTA